MSGGERFLEIGGGLLQLCRADHQRFGLAPNLTGLTISAGSWK